MIIGGRLLRIQCERDFVASCWQFFNTINAAYSFRLLPIGLLGSVRAGLERAQHRRGFGVHYWRSRVRQCVGWALCSNFPSERMSDMQLAVQCDLMSRLEEGDTD